MSNRKTPMARGHHKRLPLNRGSNRSLSRSRQSTRPNSANQPQQTLLLNPNDKTQRRTSSASSPRNHIQSNDTIISSKQIINPDHISCEILKEPIISFSQLSILTTFDIPTVEIKRECIVCMKEKCFNEFEGIYGDTCVHIQRTICNSCVYENTKYLIEDSMIYYGNIICPEDNCNGIFDYNGIRQIIIFIGKNKILFDQYDQHLIFLQLEQMPDFIWCAYGCGSGQLYDIATTTNPAITCAKCNRPTCLKHRVIWHTDMSCDQYDILKSQSSEDDANNKWLELFSKQCPQCKWNIQKYEGCDHMTCKYCKYEFCWICFVDYKLIASKGTSQHNTSCTHYQPDSSTTQ